MGADGAQVHFTLLLTTHKKIANSGLRTFAVAGSLVAFWARSASGALSAGTFYAFVDDTKISRIVCCAPSLRGERSTGGAGLGRGFGELYLLKWTTLLIPPTTLIILNTVAVVAGVSDAINNG